MKSNLFLALLLCFTLLIACNSTKKSNGAGETECVEKIDPACSCMMVYEPVCGCNNKTYSNACVAQCSGINEFTKGECDK